MSMAESIESIRREALEVVDLPTDRIDPDPKNPNEMTGTVLDALAREIQTHGFVQPVLVRPDGDRYTIIDGEHRWRVLNDLGIETVPCVIDERSEDDGRLRMVTMNRLRGEFQPERLAGVMADLSDEIGEEALTEVLGMEPEEYSAAMSPENAAEAVEEHDLVPEPEAVPEVLRWRMTPESADIVEAALEARQVAGASDRAAAMIEMLEAGGSE